MFRILAIVAALLGLVACNSSDGQSLDLEGNINPSMGYWVRVDYQTTVNDESCLTLDTADGRWIRKFESRTVKPSINGTTHTLSAGLGHKGGPGKCGWRAEKIDLCIGPRDGSDTAARCQDLFVINDFAGPAPTALFLACSPVNWNCLTLDGRTPYNEVKTFAGKLKLDLTLASGG